MKIPRKLVGMMFIAEEIEVKDEKLILKIYDVRTDELITKEYNEDGVQMR